MNIKGLLGANIIPQVKPAEKTERAGIQLDIAHDRDANGQQSFEGQKDEHGPMSDEALQKALEYLRQMAVVKENRWTVELVAVENQPRFVLIKDFAGTLIRKIPEADLWSLPFNEAPSTGKGHLLKKTA
jgi:hypothetical protein